MADKKNAAESFGEMLNQFGAALSEIFRDPKVKQKAQEFTKSSKEAAQTFAGRFKDEEVKNKFKQAGKAAQEFGKNVANYFEAKEEDAARGKDENYSKTDFDRTIDRVVHWGEQVGTKGNNYFKRTRGQRLISYNLAIVWSFILLIFFNFFHQYIAYYHYEMVEGLGKWLRESLLTEEFSAVLPVLNALLILSILGNGIRIVFDRYLVHQATSIILCMFGLATVLTFLTVFPFNFNVAPFPYAAQVLSVIVAVVFIAVAIGLVVGIVVSIVRIVVAAIKG